MRAASGAAPRPWGVAIYILWLIVSRGKIEEKIRGWRDVDNDEVEIGRVEELGYLGRD